MNAYPSDYVGHNLPLVLLAGLGASQGHEKVDSDSSQRHLGDGGFKIRAEIPPIQDEVAQTLRDTLLECDCSKRSWHAPAPDSADSKYAFRILTVARDYRFPPRKAPPPPHSPRLRPSNDNGVSPPPLILHSPISPLSPGSPLYPDGIVTNWWITKHQSRLPSVLVSFYSLVSDGQTSSLEDNKLKAEINGIKNLITTTNYKTKFVLVLVGDGPISQTELEERLVNIRRGTSFDTKALYYLPAASSAVEIRDFARVLFSTLYPSAVEYYRDLSKHARRKRNRNTVPQPTLPPTQGTSSTLSLQGWNVRYEFKLGVFAEFRQEMEAACRNYETAYEGLFGVELLGSVPAWSKRFNEVRMLADVMAIRIIRCFLWSTQTASAVRWWLKHKDRIQELVDQRGKGTENYGWETWQSVWAKTMADLVGRADIYRTSELTDSVMSALPVYHKSERSSTSIERSSPFEFLHHEGYWLWRALKHIQSRRRYALEIPDEDRKQPGSDLTSTQHTKHMYDTYLAQEPWEENPLDGNSKYDYIKDFEDTLRAAIRSFEERGQKRLIQKLSLDLGSLHFRDGNWVLGVEYMKPLWEQNLWRKHGWTQLDLQLSRSLSHAASRTGNRGLAESLAWELNVLDQAFAIPSRQSGASAEDIEYATVAIDTNVCASAISTRFAFASADGNVGEPVLAQLVVHQLVDKLPGNLQVQEIKIVFEGGLRPVILLAESAEVLVENASIINVTLADAGPDSQAKRLSTGDTQYSTADIPWNLHGKGTRIFNLQMVPREFGAAKVAGIVFQLANEVTELTLTTASVSEQRFEWWEMLKGRPVARPFGRDRDCSAINILPKPPKVSINVPNSRQTYYTNETMELQIEIQNNEAESVDVKLDLRLISPKKGDTRVSWKDDDAVAALSEGEARETIHSLPARQVNNITTTQTSSLAVEITGLSDSIDHELEAVITYTLPSDPETELRQSLALDIVVVRPFEANTAFHPRPHEEAWPNFFSAAHATSQDVKHLGLKQKFLVLADVASFATEPLLIDAVALIPRRLLGAIHAEASPGQLRSTDLSLQPLATEGAPGGIDIQPEQSRQIAFELVLQKFSLGDRQPVACDFSLEISWRRKDAVSPTSNISVLTLPKFLTPMAEPRVLLEARRVISNSNNSDAGEPVPMDTHELTFTLENPSMHFLTFNFTMESGDKFAYAGSKMKAISLVPISRYSLTYKILPLVKNDWIKINAEVVDVYFGQTLKVLPASNGVRADKHGAIQVWISD